MADLPIILEPGLERNVRGLELRDEAYHHLRRVLRLRAGDRVELRDGAGLAATALIGEAGRRHARLEVTDWVDLPPQPSPRLRLALPLLKGKRLDWVLEKATELGVAAFHLYIGDHGVVRRDKGHDRYGAIIASAFCQCRRAHLPEVTDPVPFAELLARGERSGWANVWADERLGMSGGDEAEPQGEPAAAGDLLAWIGPEGGFSETEREALEGRALALSLGPNRLRSETAALALVCRLLLPGGLGRRREA